MNSQINKSFIKDLKLPIAVNLEPYFFHFLNLIDPYYQSVSKYNILKKEVETNGIQHFEENTRSVMFKLLDTMKDKKEFDIFNNIDLKNFTLDIKAPKRELYHPDSVGKTFYSIDLVQANFQCIHYVTPEIFDGANSYEEFVTKNGFNDYMKISKQIRQVVFGNMNPKRQQSIQKFMMSKIAEKLVSVGVDLNSIYSLSSDELVFEDFSYDKSLIEKSLSELGFNLRVEKFELLRPFKQSMYVKKLDNGNVIFKMVPTSMMAEFIKRYEGKELEDLDFYFLDENKRLSKYLNPFIEDIK